MYQDNIFKELVVDNFAGGGGASTGIELALGVPVDIAINHDGAAIEMHKVNHPYTMHYQEDVFAVEPEKITGNRPVGIAWFSPDCKHFSRAKGGKPVEKKIRGLSWVVIKWAMSEVAPRCIFMENVPEIKTWGPLKEIDGAMRPDPMRVGETFQGFISILTKGIEKTHPAFLECCEFLKLDPEGEQADKLSKGLGYEVDYRELKACDYGAPTIRKRFYLVARRDGNPIVFPEPTHGREKKPYRTAAECIDWSLPCPSIFGRKKALAVNTQRRIAKGLDKFVIKNKKPFILTVNHSGDGFRGSSIDAPMTTITAKHRDGLVQANVAPYIMRNNTGNVCHGVDESLPTVTTGDRIFLCAPSLMQYHIETSEGEVRGQKTDEPIRTIDAAPRYAVNACYLTKFFSGETQAGADIQAPAPTVTGIDHSGLVEGHLCVLRNNMECRAMTEPTPTVTSHAQVAKVNTYIQKLEESQNLGHWDEVRELLNEYAGYKIAEDEILIIEINKVPYFISDVGMRMLEPQELMLAQGFPSDYVIDIESIIGRKYSKEKQIARIGNAVCPPVARALIRANCEDMARSRALSSMQALEQAYEKSRRSVG